MLFLRYTKIGSDRSDFSQVLFGARALLHHANPYVLVGPGLIYDLRWGAVYPATAYAAAIPFTPLPDGIAAAAFVGLSTFLLALGSTAGSWHRLPMFASIAFASSVQFAQWSILTTAILFLPWIASIALVKPQATFPVIAASRSPTVLKATVIGGVVLVAVSLLLLPSWPAEWLRVVRQANQLVPPMLRLGGPVILLVLLRWRRPEAWLVFLMACMPQTWAWYNVLPLLAIAATYREATLLSLVSSIGAIATVFFVGDPVPALYPEWGAAMVGFAYLPTVVAILRRPNVAARAPWLPQPAILREVQIPRLMA